MENKTAMQLHVKKLDVFIDYVKNHEEQSKVNENLLVLFNELKNNAIKLSEMEKQQMINFTNDFIDEHTFGDYDGVVQKNKTIEEYYNETYKNK